MATATADEDATGRSADSRTPKEAHRTQTPVAATTVRIAPVRWRTNESPEPSDGQGREHEQAQEEPHGPDHGEDRRRRTGRGPEQVLGGPRVVPVDERVERAVEQCEEGGVEDPDDEEQPEDHPDDDGEPPCGHTAQREEGGDEDDALGGHPGQRERRQGPTEDGPRRDEGDPHEQERRRP